MDLNTITSNIIFFIVVYILIFVFCFFIAPKLPNNENKKPAKKEKKFKFMNEVKFMKLRYKLDEEKINVLALDIIVCSMNAFIIAFASTLLCCINAEMYIKLPVAFVLIFVMLYAMFEIIGRKLHKKWGKDND